MSDFVINDRRAFTKGGELKTEPEAETPAPEGEGGGAEALGKTEGGVGADSGEKAGADSGEKKDGRPRSDDLPATFSTLTIGLATTAMMHMEGHSPDGGKADQDLSAAKHYIDILAELEKKTKGNLSVEEGNLLKTFLFDLRMRFVELSRRS
ncbi:MAG: DUF1844 domain-containing protein [Deltaproteobacteria bacterium]|jgi:hypothetical protein|nr:DUF1844 domain-containing protein [Deltaproteobacteria bacterium]